LLGQVFSLNSEMTPRSQCTSTLLYVVTTISDCLVDGPTKVDFIDLPMVTVLRPWMLIPEVDLLKHIFLPKSASTS
jgi:hypothetical protein